MSKLVVSEFLSLDGVMDTPSWTAPYWNDEMAAFKGAEMADADALLLGRLTYEGFAQAWPALNDEESGGALLVPRKAIASDRQHRLSFTSVRAMHIGNLSARFSDTSEYGHACRNCRCRHGRAFRRHGTCCRRAPGSDF